jgi:hypothetical protein
MVEFKENHIVGIIHIVLFYIVLEIEMFDKNDIIVTTCIIDGGKSTDDSKY